MIPKTDDTHDASLRSWVESANDPATDFPVQNLPLGVFRRGGARPARIGCAIGDQVLDLAACAERGLLRGLPSDVEDACRGTSLNALMALEARVRGTLRHRLSHLLRAEGGFVTARSDAAQVLVRQADVEMLLPAKVGDYTDFYASVFHATNVGKMLRPDNPLLPNYKWVPIGYHGRASSLVVSGTAVKRPSGQTETAGGGPPGFGPSRNPRLRARGRRLPGPGQRARGAGPPGGGRGPDLRPLPRERLVGPRPAEVGVPAARALPRQELRDLGEPVGGDPGGARAVPRARPSPGPKATRGPCRTSRTRRTRRTAGSTCGSRRSSSRRRCASEGCRRITVSRSNLRDLYWTLAQMVAHHASNGCNLQPGDLIASGTVSGEDEEARGCLLERTWRGTMPLALPSGEERRFLEDGDEVILRGHCEREGFARIGFGECRGVVTGATG